MSDLHFPILGTSIPKMYGRKEIMNRLMSDLTKESPSHLSIVGPRYSGKSVIMKALSEEMNKDDSPYDVVIPIDFGHQTPEDDQSFLKILTNALGHGIKACSEEYSKHLLATNDNHYDDLREVIELLNEDGVKILMLWDGFDKPLEKGKITRNLWDQLRVLASNSNFRIVTATRHKLIDLIRSEESYTSDFWGIFDMTPVRVESFDDADKEKILSDIKVLDLGAGVIKEIENWSSGYPPLFLEVLNKLIALDNATEITNVLVNDIASEPDDIITSILTYLWIDCSESTKNIYRHLLEHGDMPSSKVGNAELNSLLEKGFIKKAGNKVQKSCRFLEKYVETLSDDVGSITRLFSEGDDYNNNIRSVLELRLNQLVGIDERLKRFIQRSIEDIPDYSEVCLSNIRGVIDRSLDLIWQAELGKEKEIPLEWFKYWDQRQEKGLEYWNKKFPSKRGHEIRLLSLITGTQNSVAKAKFVSKNTFALASALHGFGDFGQHLEGASVPVGVAISAIIMSIELASLLVSELNE